MTESRALRLLALVVAAMLAALLVLQALGSMGVGMTTGRLWTRAGGLANPFFAAALLGSFFVHLATTRGRSPGRRALPLMAAAIGAALALVRPDLAPLSLVSILGLLSLSVLTVQSREGHVARSALILAASLPLFILVSRGSLEITVWAHPRSLDGALDHADRALGFAPQRLVQRLFDLAPPIALLSSAVYVLLPCAMGVVYASEIRLGPATPRVDTALVLMTAGAIGFVVYHLFPAIGPASLFGTDPSHYPEPSLVPLVNGDLASAPRNCMPSLHTTWALLLLWQAGPRSIVARALASAFLVLTLLATLGFGLHYLYDLVVAVPFSVAVWTLCWQTRPGDAKATTHARWRTFAVACALTSASLVLLRYGTASLERWPVSGPLVCALLVSVPLGQRHRLVRLAWLDAARMSVGA